MNTDNEPDLMTKSGKVEWIKSHFIEHLFTFKLSGSDNIYRIKTTKEAKVLILTTIEQVHLSMFDNNIVTVGYELNENVPDNNFYCVSVQTDI